MRALVCDPRGAEGVALREVPEPVATGDQALVEVHASSLNWGDARRIATEPVGALAGWDIAGVVLKASATSPPAGTRVLGIRKDAAWAERCAVPGRQLAALPETVSFETAAAIPVAGVTALRLLALGKPIIGGRVLVTGAAGGVGRFAVQLAHRAGAEVTAIVGSATRAEGLALLGADRVVIEPEEPAGRYDLILELVGGASLSRLLQRIDYEGTLVMFGNTSNAEATFDPRPLFLRGGVHIVGSSLSYSMAKAAPARDLAYLAGLVAAGGLDPQVALVVPWTETASAIRRLLDRKLAGKAILTIDRVGEDRMQ